MITARTGEIRATEFLRQRSSIDIMRGNSLSILGTIPEARALDEIQYFIP